MAKSRFLLGKEGDPTQEQRSVPFLRPFEWVATALTSFRERPLPSAYTPTVQPTFDLFSTSRLGQFEVEDVLGDLGSIEVFGPRIALDKYRLYMSVDVFHDDAVNDHKFLFSRVVPDPTIGFPFVVFETSLKGVTVNEHVAVQNVLVPPDGRIDVVVSIPASMPAGSRITMRNLFIEFEIGEPSRDCIGG